MQVRCDILMTQFRHIKPVIKEAITEHHVLPLVEVLVQLLVELLAALVLDHQRIEEALGDLDVFVRLHHHGQPFESLRDTPYLVIFLPEITIKNLSL